MFGGLLLLLAINTAAVFILPGLAGVFYNTPLQSFFSTIAVFALFFELILPGILVSLWFSRPEPRQQPQRARYTPEPVGDFEGFDETARQRIRQALDREAESYGLLTGVYRPELPVAPPAARLASPETAYATGVFNGDQVERRPDGSWYLPRLKLHVEADGTSWKEI